tara:strand:- start:915 stop:1604 length:690 start_codon:yes stop_codon:yes gene_type:complete
MKIICEIPVREGSKRVPNKNILKIKGKRVVEYTIDSALKSGVFHEVWINTNSKVIINEYKNSNLIHSDKVLIYKRPENLCSDDAKSDDFNYDFATNTQSDILVMLNPVCPLLKPESIKMAVSDFLSYKNKFDTLISCSSTKMQGFVNEFAVNFDSSEALRPSQENKSIKILNWAITIWDTRKLINRHKKKGFCVLGDNRLLFEISPTESIKISNQTDFDLVESILQNKK